MTSLRTSYEEISVVYPTFRYFRLTGRRVVPDLIYDAARLFNLVLVGYSANDPPMRYLLNAVAADEIVWRPWHRLPSPVGSARS